MRRWRIRIYYFTISMLTMRLNPLKTRRDFLLVVFKVERRWKRVVKYIRLELGRATKSSLTVSAFLRSKCRVTFLERAPRPTRSWGTVRTQTSRARRRGTLKSTSTWGRRDWRGKRVGFRIMGRRGSSGGGACGGGSPWRAWRTRSRRSSRVGKRTSSECI